ncbi:MAG: hypothetical protein A2639_00320 [Candidatus Staskawiczbacteria bacterium RIFCSPHIGHO2_01_FULL_34_27]|uniref:Recombinase domain-containing protein n=2 Tax=Candidatus Staskawicziibacteriota TaxID=1817916 RepID=A0A1G2HLJ5_9BACT|nr:MAG: hypothetical protein A2639_00320 [Candidatus Staskawiczbacteria bacterium RIFCSPHIGHO2_01_FULL_34_27]OGZ66881.1 MAG: hypothetical protein A3D34_01010 [Candidatus Staskawiczbacteria bacterium RIFCSPHIGHO2_02_FULL_33_16]
MKRIALYCRVSTDNQEKNETIENQLRDLYKVYNKTDVIKVYQDNPGSGADPDRKGLWELRKDATKKMFDVIGLWDSSRLARDLKLSLILRDEFKELGINIEVMGRESDDSDTGKIVSIIEATMDEIERNRIKRRFTSGRDRRLSEGKLIGCYPPFGYRHIRRNKEKGTDASFEINEQEAILVRKIFELYIKFESILLVAQELVKMGIKGRGKGRSEPGFMQVSSVSKILRRETYIGNHYFGKSSPCIAKFHLHKIRKHRFTGRRTNPRADWKVVNVPTIIDKETFDKAQEIMKKRAKHRRELSKYQFMCQGLIRCVRCSRNYGGKVQKSQNDYLFYRCPQAYTSNINDPPCKSRSMGAGKLDRAIWGFVSDLIQDKERIQRAVFDIKEKREKHKFSNKKSCDNLLLEKNNLKIKRKRLFDLYSESDNEISDSAKEDLKNKLKDIDEKERFFDKQILELEKELGNINNIDLLEKEIEKTRKLYNEKIHSPSYELKKFIVRKWIGEVGIQDDGSLKIKIKIPKGQIPDELPKEYIYSASPNGAENSLLLGSVLKFEESITP